MSPAEDASLLLRIVRRHLQAMQLNLDPRYPEEEWGFQAQQALEKLLKARLVLSDLVPRRTH
jgi:HEPN domain-containing protein